MNLYYSWGELFTSAGRALISTTLIALFLFMVPGAFIARFFLAFVAALLVIAFLIRRHQPKLKIISATIKPVREKEAGELIAVITAETELRAVSLDCFRMHPSLKRQLGKDTVFRANETRTLSLKIKTTHRGAFTFSHIAALVPEPLGLVQSHFFYPSPAEFLVYPRYLHIRDFPFLTRGANGRDFALLLMPSLDRGMDFVGVRPYREGDSVRDIHHLAFARYQKPFTKEFAIERGAGVVLVLDIRCRYFSEKIFIERAIALVGALAFWLYERGILGRFFINDDEMNITSGDVMSLVMASLARIQVPPLFSFVLPQNWSPKARPMGPVLAVSVVRNESDLIKKQIVVSDLQNNDDSVLHWEPSEKVEVSL